MDASKLKKGDKGVIKEITLDGLERQRLLDLGFIPNQEIMCNTVVFSTYSFNVMGSQYGIRKEVAKNIILV